MEQYSNLVSKILNNGVKETGRNGVTCSVFGETMRFSLETLPMLTTKKISFHNILEELLWFISGKTDNKILNDKGVHIWDANASQDFLSSRGLSYSENDLGPIYGHQWRHFNAPYTDCHTDYTEKGVDQLQNIIDALKDPVKRFSRRLVLSSWNPCQLEEMALPPCHIMLQFNVVKGGILDLKHGSELIEPDRLSCILYQRSADVGLGMPYNITSYSILTKLIAHHCGLVPDEFIYMVGNAHIYEEHIEGLKMQNEREHHAPPLLLISNHYENINDYKASDFQLLGYYPHPVIKLKMIA